MQSGTITSTVRIGGTGFTSTVTREAEGQISHVVDVPAGIAGAISATGVDGLVTGHGLVMGNLVDIHWTASGVLKCRRGVTVDTAAANAITFDDTPAASGDALPAEDTAVIVGKQVEVATEWSGDASEIVSVRLSQIGTVDFRDADSSLLAINLEAAGAWYWASGQGVANPFASQTPTKLVVSNGSITAATLHVGVLYQSVA